MIKNIDTRVKLIKKIGIDYIFVLKSEKILKMMPEKFLSDYLIKKVNMKYLIVGRDFKFGAGAKGNIKFLKENEKKYDYRLITIADVKFKNKRISSTLIRKYLKIGKIKEVEKMLGRRYFIEGKVIHGKHIGFDFPTANFKIENKNFPLKGVWAVCVEYNNAKYKGIANIGIAPTLKKEKEQILETHIFNFNKNIYGKNIKVFFIKKIRNEKRFNSKKELTEQVKNDIKIAKKILKKRGFL